ncbi:MAG TPA: type 1 glutamine amidotransferase [Desulfuromonadales bacterium]|nr:type 1 glutamine amidotransferase [Desulfuromonadales bacterium]
MIYIIQNDPRVPAGIYGRHLQDRDIPQRTVHLYAGESLPPLTEVSAFIVLGGYMGVHDEEEYPFLRQLKAFMRRAVEAGTPLLGICLGGQLLAQVLGGEVFSRHRGEKGLQEIHLTSVGQDDPLFAGLPPAFAAFEWHNDSFEVPSAAVHLAASAACPGQAFRYRNAWGVQFHPEVDREIVSAWSAVVDPAGGYATEFAADEAAHRAMAQRLLKNFLDVAQTAKAQRLLSPARCTR